MTCQPCLFIYNEYNYYYCGIVIVWQLSTFFWVACDRVDNCLIMVVETLDGYPLGITLLLCALK